MPELPEVETVVRDLREAWRGAALADLCILDARVLEAGSLSASALRGGVCRNVSRRGKYILQHWGRLTVLQHLRMTGQMLPEGNSRLPDAADTGRGPQRRAEWRLADGARWVFFDTRRFGTLRILDDPDAWFAARGFAPEPMGDDAPSARAHFIRIASARRAPIKTVLLDQTAIVGVGNIYADEGLFRAGLYPRIVAGDLSARRLGALFDAVRAVMAEAIARRGTSMSDYLDINGNPGTFRACLNVYRRTAEPCRACGRPVARDVVAGRSTHFCPHCQRVPGKLRERR